MKSVLLALLLAPVALGADVAGYVYTPDGSPVEGAVVRAGNASVKTNKDGAFTLSNLADGVVELDVDGKAHPLVLAGDVVSIALNENEERPSRQAAARGEGTVSGKVTVDGKPLANAPVLVGETRVLTNAKGEYVAKGLEVMVHPVTLDERLFPRLRWPSVDVIADLSKTRDATVDLALRSALMMRGRVVDADGKPVARARVQLVLANRSTLEFTNEPSFARTTPDGRFAFPAPPGWNEREQVSVAVTPLLHSTIRSKPFVLGDADRTIDITLPRLETVRLRVLDRAGKAIPEARVAFASTADTSAFESATWLIERDVERRSPRTNAAGELVVQLAVDTYDFAVAATGFQSRAVTKTITKPATVDVALDAEALLRGRVHRGDRGVANVTVNVHAGRLRNRFFTTDAGGKFEIRGLAPGTYRVAFSKTEELIQRTMDVEAPGDVDVALPRTGTLRVRVIDGANATPIRDFTYEVESAQTATGRMQQSVSADDGTFTVEIPASTYRVTVGAPGFTMSEPAEVRVTENDTTAIDVPLSQGATIAGRVLDENAAPVAHADVTIMPASYEQSRSAARVGPPQTRTANDGTFTATGIDAGEAQMIVQKQGYAMHRRTIDASGTTSVDVTLTRGLSIQGTVTRGGRPVARAQVLAVSPAIGGDHQTAVSDEDGRFTLSGLIAARYSVTASLDEQRTEVRDVDPAKQKEIVLALDAQQHGVVFGLVTGIPPATGGKSTRRVVMVHSEDGSAEGMIDDAGNYRIENAPVGDVSVLALVETSTRSVRTSTRKQIEVVAGQALRVDLELAGSLRVSGRVTLDGRPIAAHVGFTSEEGTMAAEQTSDDGTYEVLLGAPGRYHVYARAEQVHERHFQTMREIRGGETIDIDLREHVLEGTVVDAVTRQPIDGALVTLAPMAMASIIAEAQTDASGRFQLVMAGTGSLRLIATAHGYAQRTLPVSSMSHYAFELSPAADLRIRVLDARTNAPLEGYVVFSDETGILPVRPRRSTDGTTYIFSLAPGKYRAMAIVQDYTPKTVEVTAPGSADIMME